MYDYDLKRGAIFTDGAAKGNRRGQSQAGYAYWIPYDEILFSTSDPDIHTNNQAELMAILSVLDHISDFDDELGITRFSHYDIYSDSEYAINVITWKWMVRRGRNLTLIKRCQYLLGYLEDHGISITFHHVYAHQSYSHSMSVREMFEAENNAIVDREASRAASRGW
ncbi:hypothetical protein ADUPG1_013246 [Aduncisulcus paluster]|uniref:ribonuclease H n=1 Tax=Aduncisulcus paluster TaxID=2918883 RepID=A0ABQ5K498_9EUKA|nr:hypothetical protein ADUPG1_013246 [Aduncisulcus paluster]